MKGIGLELLVHTQHFIVYFQKCRGKNEQANRKMEIPATFV